MTQVTMTLKGSFAHVSAKTTSLPAGATPIVLHAERDTCELAVWDPKKSQVTYTSIEDGSLADRLRLAAMCRKAAPPSAGFAAAYNGGVSSQGLTRESVPSRLVTGRSWLVAPERELSP